MSPTEMLPAPASLASSGSLNDSGSQGCGASATTSSEVDQLLQWIQHHLQHRNLSPRRRPPSPPDDNGQSPG